MEGLELLKFLVKATGLPPEAVERELGIILAKNNFKAESLTVDDVRELLSSYLQDVLIEAKELAAAK